jgi:hypothetical protein
MMSLFDKTESQSMTRNPRLLEALAWLMPLTLAAGSDFAVFECVGVSWYAYRVVVLFTALIASIDFILVRRKVAGWQIAVFTFMAVWFLWSLINQPDGIQAAEWMRGVFYVLIAGATLMSFYYLSMCRMQKTIIHASVVGFLINASVSIVQMLTSIRPQSSFADELSSYSSEHFVRFAPAGMFGNPNHFAFYVCVQLFLVYTFRSYMSLSVRVALYSLGGFFIAFTQSRVGMAAAALMGLLIVIENRHWLRIQSARFLRPLVYSLVFLTALLVSTKWVNTRTVALRQEAARGDVLQVKSSGDADRWNLIQCGMEMIQSSNYLGVGSGQFATAAQSSGCQIGSMKNPHCGFIEIGSESGVIVFALLIVAVVFFVWSSRKEPYALKALAWAGVLCFLQFANSSFVSIPVAWCFMAWPFLISSTEKEELN